MMRAYDEALLPRACDSLGRMLDFSAHSLRMDPSAMMDLFVASGAASLFGAGDIRLICGMSGMELAYEVLERSGLRYERTSPRHTISLSGEYWCGFALSLIQWGSCLPFEAVTESFPVSAFIGEYGSRRTAYLDSLPLDLSAAERAEKIREFGRLYASDAAAKFVSGISSPEREKSNTPLKKARIKSGLSQSQLAKASGVPLRTIQQYEQRQKDINRARAEYLIMLSSALGCSPASLLEKKQE